MGKYEKDSKDLLAAIGGKKIFLRLPTVLLGCALC